MRKKRIIALSIILGIFAVLIILTSTVFMLQSVSINYLSTNMKVLSDANSESIIESAKFKKGGNVLFMNFKTQTANIEAANPFAKVEKIERKFPNKIVVHISERTPAFYVSKQGIAYVFDSDFKLLAKVFEDNLQTDDTLLSSIATAPKFSGISISDGLSVGQFEAESSLSAIAKKIEVAMASQNRSILDLATISAKVENNVFVLQMQADNNPLILEISGLTSLDQDLLDGFAVYYAHTESGGSTNGKIAKIGNEWQFIANN